jgi:hypothetical protein
VLLGGGRRRTLQQRPDAVQPHVGAQQIGGGVPKDGGGVRLSRLAVGGTSPVERSMANSSRTVAIVVTARSIS